MTKEDVRRRIDELSEVKKGPFEAQADRLEVALFIEDAFGIVLSDHDMAYDKLGTLRGAERLVLERLGLM